MKLTRLLENFMIQNNFPAENTKLADYSVFVYQISSLIKTLSLGDHKYHE